MGLRCSQRLRLAIVVKSEVQLMFLLPTILKLYRKNLNACIRTDKCEQTVKTLIRLLEQSDQSLHCLPSNLHHLDA